MRKIIYTESFRQDFKFIGLYIVENFGVDVYLSFEDKMQKTLSNLATFPRIGRSIIMKKEFRFVKGVNLIFYEFDEDKIIFLKIKSTRQK